MSDEHGWPDFSASDGPDDHGAQQDYGAQHGHDEPAAGSPFHDELFGPDDTGSDDTGPGDAGADGFDGPGFDGPGFDGLGAEGFDGLGGDGDPGEPADAAGAGWDDQYEPGTGHDDAAGAGVVDVTEGHGLGPVGADPDAAPDAEQVGLFPPVVDIGPLPEPVDGFPWIDTGSLGLYHSGLLDAVAAEPVPAQDLAAYAGEELPPGVDPWAALADSDDPATSALAQWWRPQA